MNKLEIEKIERNVRATLAIEGKQPSKEGKMITRKYLNREIDSKTAIQAIKDKYLNLCIMPMFIKINPNFGTDFYNSTKHLLFYGAVIAVVIALIKTLTQDKLKIIVLLGQILMSALILFIIYNPLNMLAMGEFLYNFMFSMVEELQVKQVSGV
jgi:hypothetical protein